MRCETTSSVKECALRARSSDVLVARVVVSLVVDAVVGLTLGVIAHVDVVAFVVAILHRIFCIWRYTLYRNELLHLLLDSHVVNDEEDTLLSSILHNRRKNISLVQYQSKSSSR